MGIYDPFGDYNPRDHRYEQYKPQRNQKTNGRNGRKQQSGAHHTRGGIGKFTRRVYRGIKRESGKHPQEILRDGERLIARHVTGPAKDIRKIMEKAAIRTTEAAAALATFAAILKGFRGWLAANEFESVLDAFQQLSYNYLQPVLDAIETAGTNLNTAAFSTEIELRQFFSEITEELEIEFTQDAQSAIRAILQMADEEEAAFQEVLNIFDLRNLSHMADLIEDSPEEFLEVTNQETWIAVLEALQAEMVDTAAVVAANPEMLAIIAL